MPYLFNRDAVTFRSSAAQHAVFAENARTESMLADDLGISRHKLRLLRWAGCAPSAIRVENVVYYTFEDIDAWLRRFH